MEKNKENNFRIPLNSFSFAVKFTILIPILLSLVLLFYIAQNREINTSTTTVNAQINTPNTIYLNPLSGNFRRNETFTISVNMNTDQNPINALETYILYPSKSLEVVNTSINQDNFDIIIKKEASNGKITFILGSTKPLNGNLTVGTITFKALKKGASNVSFSTPLNVVSSTTNQSVPYTISNAQYRVK